MIDWPLFAVIATPALVIGALRVGLELTRPARIDRLARRERARLSRLCICGHTFGQHRARPPGEPSGCKWVVDFSFDGERWIDHVCPCPDFRAADRE